MSNINFGKVIRRLMLACVIGLFDSSSAVSSVLGLILSVLFTWIFSECKPYKEPVESYLAIALSHSLSIFFLASLIIKTNHVDELGLQDQLFGIILAILLVLGPIVVMSISLIDLFPMCTHYIKVKLRKCNVAEEVNTSSSTKFLQENEFLPVAPIMTHQDEVGMETSALKSNSSDGYSFLQSESESELSSANLHSLIDWLPSSDSMVWTPFLLI